MTKKLIRIICAFCLSVFFPLSAAAVTVNKMIVFGDSLSDIGNIYALTDKQIPIDPPYFHGRFSNGPLWIEHIAKLLNVDITSNTQFLGFAYAGAWATSSATDDSYPLIDLDWEVGSYMVQNGIINPPDDHTLFVLWIGNNDYLNGRERGNIEVVTTEAVAAIERNIHTLLDAGAKHFLIINLPDLGLTPIAQNGGQAFATRVSQLSSTHNQKLAKMINALKAKHTKVDFIMFDLAPYFTDLVTHPGKYNIKETIKSCYEGDFGELKYKKPAPKLTPITRNLNAKANYPSPCANPGEYIFWDHVHPTAAVHQLLANFASQALFEKGIG